MKREGGVAESPENARRDVASHSAKKVTRANLKLW